MSTNEQVKFTVDASSIKSALKNVAHLMQGVGKTTDKVNSSLAKQSANIQKLINVWSGLSKVAEKAGSKLSSAQTDKDNSQIINRVLSSLKAQGKAYDELAQKAEDLNTDKMAKQKFIIEGVTKALKGLSTFLSGSLTASLKVVESGMSNVAKGAKQIGSAISTLKNTAKTSFNRMTSSVRNMTDASRLLMQGLQSITRALTYFVSLPVTLFVRKYGQAVLDFDDALVRVQKTTGMTSTELEGLKRQLMAVASGTATSHEELASMAEQLGQMGIGAEDNIAGIVRVLNMISSATDITADEVAKTMGKIASAMPEAFEKAGGDFESVFESWGNTINVLENNTKATAKEIVNAVLGVAEAAGMLETVGFEGVAAFTSVLIGAGLSADEAGTALRNLFIQTTKNTEAIAGLFNATHKYSDAANIMTAMNQDALGFFQELISSFRDGGMTVEDLGAVFETWGIRSGRALAGIIKGSEDLGNALGVVKASLGDTTSLWTEYQQSLLSTKNQLGVLNNNLTNLGITIGDSVLPIINEFIQYLVAGTRLAIEAFQKLDPVTQRLVVGIAALALVAGPLLFFLTQIGTGMALIAMAGIRAFQAVISIVSVFGSLITVGKSLLSVLWGAGRLLIGLGQIIVGGFLSALIAIPLTIVKLALALINLVSSLTSIANVFGGATTAVVGFVTSVGGILTIGIPVVAFFIGFALVLRAFLKVLGKITVGLIDFASMLADFGDWGSKAMDSFADGVERGANKVVSVVNRMLEAIAYVLEAHSPPKGGPLQHIDKWGKTLFDTYLAGFANADFSILSKVAGKVSSVLKNLATLFDKDKTWSLTALGTARQNLAGLIKDFNKTGKVSDKWLSATVKDLGEAGDEMADYIKYQLEYKRVLQDIEELESRRAQTLDEYGDKISDIASSDLSAEERVNLIREARKARDEELRSIDDQADGLDELRDATKNQLDLQEALIDAYLDQDSIQAQLIEQMKAMAGSAEGIADALGGLGSGTPVDLGALDDAIRTFETLEEKINLAKLAIEAFFLGLSGKNIQGETQNVSDPLLDKGGGYNVAEGLENTLSDGQLKAYTFGDNIAKQFLNIKDAAYEAVTAARAFLAGFIGGKFETPEGDFEFFDIEEAEIFGGAVRKNFDEVVGMIEDTALEIFGWFIKLGTKFDLFIAEMISGFVNMINNLALVMGGPGAWLMEAIGGPTLEIFDTTEFDYVEKKMKFIADYADEFGERPDEEFLNFLDEVYTKGGDVDNAIKNIWEQLTKMDGLEIETYQTHYLTTIEGQTSTAGGGGGNTSGHVMMATGGIVTGATKAIVGEAGAEAVIPLDRLPSLMSETMGGVGGGDIHIHNPVVREDQDLDRIAEAVEEKLIESNNLGLSFMGA